MLVEDAGIGLKSAIQRNSRNHCLNRKTNICDRVFPEGIETGKKQTMHYLLSAKTNSKLQEIQGAQFGSTS
jgi:hypothetical protein